MDDFPLYKKNTEITTGRVRVSGSKGGLIMRLNR